MPVCSVAYGHWERAEILAQIASILAGPIDWPLGGPSARNATITSTRFVGAVRCRARVMAALASQFLESQEMKTGAKA